MKKSLSLTLLSLSIIIISCSSPLDRAYKQDTLEEDIVTIKESISEEELNTLAGYIALKTFAGDDMLGKTYNDLLNEAKKLQEEIRMQEEEDAKKLLIDRGSVVCDYYYNIALSRKKLSPINIKFLSDTVIVMKGSRDMYEYKIKSIDKSTNEIFSVIAFGGNVRPSVKQEDYKIVCRFGLVSVERLSNNAKWWFVSESARNGFETELEGAGLMFHK